MAKVLERTAASAHRLSEYIRTSAGRDASMVDIDEELARRNKEDWDRWIGILIGWGRDPALLTDDDLVPPLGSTISRACKLASKFQRQDFPPPTRVVADPNGVIAFEKDQGNELISVRVQPDDTYLILCFRGNQLVYSELIADENAS
ncbi:MAG: hypothetical protein WD468_12975 [Pirellulales bacterium]